MGARKLIKGQGLAQTGNAVIAVATVLLAVAPFFADVGTLRLAIEILVTFAVALSFNLLGGYAGLLSFGQNVFVGLGAYCLFLAANWTAASPFALVLFSAVLCGIFAFLVAPMLFRLRDAYFSIGMWVLADAVRVAIGQWPPSGMSNGLTLQLSDALQNDWFIPVAFWFAAGLAVGGFVVTIALLRAKFGLGLMAVRDNEDAAAGIGVDVWRSRLAVFVFSGAVCGAAGAIYYMTILFIDPTSAFDFDWVVRSLFIVVIGGIGTLEGVFVGTTIYFVMRELFSDAGNWYLILMGLIAIAVMLFAPSGIWGVIESRFGFSLFSIRRHAPDMRLQLEPRGSMESLGKGLCRSEFKGGK